MFWKPKLLRYLQDSDPFYQTESFPRIVERVNFYKIQRKGVDIMCEITDRIRREGKIEGKIEIARNLLKMNMPRDQIADK